VAQANNQEIDVTAAQLSQLTYQSVPGADDSIQVRVSDGNAWSNWAGFTVTAPPLVIESSGSTSLVQFGDNYYLDGNGGGTGPELTSGGVAVVAGQSANWTPIAAEQTAIGYEIAWHNTFTGNYEVWNADSSGNVLSASISGASGTNTALESIETSFQQDLNGDHVIGTPSPTSPAAAPISAPASGNAILSGTAASDTFVFKAHFGNDTVAGFQPGVDQVDLDHTLFASVADLLAHTADDAAGSAVVTVGADQSITFDHVSTQLLQQHTSDFHLV
jgi:hypothetical protein